MLPLLKPATNSPSDRGSHSTATHLACSALASGVSVAAMMGLLLGGLVSWALRDKRCTAGAQQGTHGHTGAC